MEDLRLTLVTTDEHRQVICGKFKEAQSLLFAKTTGEYTFVDGEDGSVSLSQTIRTPMTDFGEAAMKIVKKLTEFEALLDLVSEKPGLFLVHNSVELSADRP